MARQSVCRWLCMGLNSLSRDLFSEAWVQALRGAPESAMSAAVRVFDPKSHTAVYDAAENDYTVDLVSIYQGKARVQPLRSAGQVSDPINPTTVQAVLVSIPIANKALDLRTGLQMFVLASPLNPTLVNYKYVISEIMDSSNPIEKTFLCTVNQELRVN